MTEALVVDTNVLEHVFHPTINRDGHINSFLRKFALQKRKLCVDKPKGQQSGRIIREYKHRLQFHRRALDEEQHVLQWLRYLLEFAERVDAHVDFASPLGKSVCQEMDKVKAERSDQVFVYVACALDSVMVSNNTKHVTGIRAQLKACAQKAGSHRTDFVSSTHANGEM